MKFQSLTIILTFTLFLFGCGLTGKFQVASNDKANIAPAVESSGAVSPTPTRQLPPTPDQTTDLGRNLLAFGAGTNVVAVTSESKMNYEKSDKLIDESGAGEGWRTADGKVANESVTFELPARTTLETIVFDTVILSDNKIAAKDVRVEISGDSATGGFQTILETTLRENPKNNSAEQGLDNQIFTAKKKIAGRFCATRRLAITARPKVFSPKKSKATASRNRS